MDDEALKGMKITRNTYQFNLRRRYEPTEHFRVKKSADNPIARLAEMFSSKKKGLQEPKEKPKGGGSSAATVIIIIMLAVLMFGLLVGWTMVSAGPKSAPASPPAPIPEFSASFSQRLTDLQMLSYGSQDSGKYQVYLSSEFSALNAKTIGPSAKLYPSIPPRQVFVLRYPRSGADIYPQFREKLDSYLRGRGFSISEISPSDLENIPPGSTLLLPTGYMPSFLLDAAPPAMPKFPPKASYSPFLLSLAAGGTRVIYIGDTFDFLLSPTGTPEEATKFKKEASGISFDTKSKPVSENGFGMRVPLYTAKLTARETEAPEQVWGSISSLNAGQGSIIMLPESLDGGWADDSSKAAEDIGKLIVEMPYLHPVSESYASINLTNSTPSRANLVLSPSRLKAGFLRLTFLVNDTNGVARSFFDDYYVHKGQLGDLYFAQNSTITPRYLGGKRYDVFVALREQTSAPVKLYFELSSNKTVMERHELEAGLTTPIITKKSTLQTDVPPGQYLLSVADEPGKIYAATLIDVVGVEIKGPHSYPGGPNVAYRDSTFNFSFLMNGQPAMVDYVRIYVDGAPAASQEFRKISQASFAPKYAFTGGPGVGIPHTIVLDFGGAFVQKYTYNKIVVRQFYDNPWVQFLAVVALAVGLVGIYLRRPEKAMFLLDIPDFPPVSLTKIPVKTSVVLSIFDQINRDYSWERMPLKVEEMKGGFMKMTYNGKPIAIGDYNLERVLERLEELSLTERSLGYWGLVKWSTESGQPIERRAIFRRLRDLCVNNAIRFSKLDALPYCDVKLLIGTSEYFVHFFTGDYKVVSRALETVPLGRSWILFTDSYTLEKFRGHLQSSESAALALKMEIYNYRAKLVTIDDMPDLLKSMKMEG